MAIAGVAVEKRLGPRMAITKGMSPVSLHAIVVFTVEGESGKTDTGVSIVSSGRKSGPIFLMDFVGVVVAKEQP